MGIVDTRTVNRPAPDPRPEPGDERLLEWMQAHATPAPGRERHTIPLGVFTPHPPATPRPRLLLANLLGGEVLVLERVEAPGGACPDFIVRTLRGRNLGRLSGEPAAMIEFALCEGLGPQATVFAAGPAFPAESALLVRLDIVVWCASCDWVERPEIFTGRRRER